MASYNTNQDVDPAAKKVEDTKQLKAGEAQQATQNGAGAVQDKAREAFKEAGGSYLQQMTDQYNNYNYEISKLQLHCRTTKPKQCS